MPNAYQIYIWKKAPFLRILLPLIFGIILEFYFKIPVSLLTTFAVFFIILFLIFSALPEAKRFRYRALQGIIISLFIVVFGSLITWKKDIRNDSNWYGNNIETSGFLVGTIHEPPVEKSKSYKALVTIESIVNKGSQQKSKGKILVYFDKEPTSKRLKYGDRIIVGKHLQPIKNSGNPAAFNYKEYCAFQQIFHQVFLKKNEWVLSKEYNQASLMSLIFDSKNYILRSLQNYIPGVDESSVAKALLIGYRIDLDKDLVQAYSNVGVVHLIAISGMHLALIYFFLVWLFAKIPFVRNSELTKLVLVLSCLWFFSLLTGAPASVLRAAVMFSFIAIGDLFDKRNSIYNSLACSAFILLCFDPYMLWDVGFQLSYLAVLSIVVFQKYIYNWFYFKNKILDASWKLASVSLSAQILTLPICIYYFHQFPLLFLVSNMIAIPLSTIALWGSILIVVLSPIPFMAIFFGKILWAVVWLLNYCVLKINLIPFSLWGGLSISISDTVLLYFFSFAILFWIVKKNMAAFKIAVAFIFAFVLLSSFKKWEAQRQKKIIVYNVAQHNAIDFIKGDQYYFVGDLEEVSDKLLMNYNVNPARVAFMANHESSMPEIIYKKNNFYQFYNRKLLVVDSSRLYYPLDKKISIDYIVISKNPQITISSLSNIFDCGYYIFDASNTPWKIEKWKKECEELHLQSHSVSEQGAFVTDL